MPLLPGTSLRGVVIFSETSALQRTLISVDEVPDVIPSSYYSCSDWPTDIASIGLSWSEKEDGSYRIDQGRSEAFLFQDCTNITLPCTINGVPITEIAPYAFTVIELANPADDAPAADLLLATSLTLPQSLEIIGNDSIVGLNPQLIHIPAQVRQIGSLGFRALPDEHRVLMRRFTVDEGNCCFKALEGSLYSNDKSRLLSFAKPYPEVIHLPKDVLSIDSNAFSHSPATPEVIHVPDFLKQLPRSPNQECLWVCALDKPSYKSAQRNHYCVATRQYAEAKGYLYDLISPNEAMLIRYQGSSDDLVVPSHFSGLPLTAIAPRAFRESTRSLFIPDTVMTIAGRCPTPQLRRLKLSANIRSIGEGAFSQASLEQAVVIPKSCTSIGANSFGNATCIFEAHSTRVKLFAEMSKLCFIEGSPPFDFESYDRFLNDRLRSNNQKMEAILLRITYPFRLSHNNRKNFLRNLQWQVFTVIEHIIAHDDLMALAALLNEGFFSQEGIDNCLRLFYQEGYTQGIMALLDYRHSHYVRETRARFVL